MAWATEEIQVQPPHCSPALARQPATAHLAAATATTHLAAPAEQPLHLSHALLCHVSGLLAAACARCPAGQLLAQRGDGLAKRVDARQQRQVGLGAHCEVQERLLKGMQALGVGEAADVPVCVGCMQHSQHLTQVWGSCGCSYVGGRGWHVEHTSISRMCADEVLNAGF